MELKNDRKRMVLIVLNFLGEVMSMQEPTLSIKRKVHFSWGGLGNSC